MPKPTGPTNPETIEIVKELQRSKNYSVVARHLSKSRRRKEGVNVGKISISSQNNDVVIIPGTCLGAGNIDKKVTVYALSFSASATKKIESKGGKCLTMRQLLKDKAKGRIMI